MTFVAFCGLGVARIAENRLMLSRVKLFYINCGEISLWLWGKFLGHLCSRAEQLRLNRIRLQELLLFGDTIIVVSIHDAG
jgi:hypothetical protein